MSDYHFKFKLHYQTNYTECLVLTGSTPYLGNFDPLCGLRLKFEHDHIWSLDTSLPLPAFPFEYKFVLCREHLKEVPDQVLRWEEGPNHQLVAADFNSEHVLILHEFWNFPQLSIKNLAEIPSEIQEKRREEMEKKVQERKQEEEKKRKEAEERNKRIPLTIIDNVLKEYNNSQSCLADKEIKMSIPDAVFNAIELVSSDKREEALANLCNQLKECSKQISLPPKEDSIVLDASAKPLKGALFDANASQGFLESVTTSEITEEILQIEQKTGFNVVTGTQAKMILFKLDSNHSNLKDILQNKEEIIMNAFLQDLGKVYGIPAKSINIRRKLVATGLEILFSLPENISENLKLTNSHFPTLASIVNDSKINNYQISQTIFSPDPQQAKKLLSDYVCPVTINLQTNGSLLMEKFSDNLPVLASLSPNVRIIHSPQAKSIEVHGLPSERGKVLFFFSELEDLLRKSGSSSMIVLDFIPENAFFNELWIFLYQKAINFIIMNCINEPHKLQQNTLRINPNLSKGCPAAQSIVNALKKMRLDPLNTSPESIYNNGVYGWHGTRTAENVLSIAVGGLDPMRRSGQCYGPGEYCAVSNSYSQSGYWGNTNTLFLFFILRNNPYYKLDTHHVVNNPSRNEMYMVPILVATFNKQVPLKIEDETIVSVLKENPVNSSKIGVSFLNDNLKELFNKENIVSSPSFENLMKETILKAIECQIDPKTEHNKKISKEQFGRVTGKFYMLLPNGEKEIKTFEGERVLQCDFVINSIDSNIITAVINGGNIIKSCSDCAEKNVFVDEKTCKEVKFCEPSVFSQKLIYNSFGNKFVQKETFITVNSLENSDFIKDGSMAGVKIMMINFVQTSQINSNLSQAFNRKGFTFKDFNQIPAHFKDLLFDSKIFILISSSTTLLTQNHLEIIEEFYIKGGSLYIFGDNLPFYGEANQVLERIFGVSLTGNDYGDQNLLKKNSNSRSGFDYDQHKHIFTGITQLYEGITISYLLDQKNFKPLIYGTEGHVVAACNEENGRRAIVDGGFTRLYYKWDAVNTQRYILNCMGWLSRIDID